MERKKGEEKRSRGEKKRREREVKDREFGGGRLQMRHMCVGGSVGRREGVGEIVHLLSNLVLVISVAQVSAQCLHPISRATCGRSV